MFRPRILACLFAIAGVAFADVPRPMPATIDMSVPGACPPRVLKFRSLSAELDNHVLLNLLTDVPMRKSELPLTVVAGEITRCESQPCTGPRTLRVSSARAPVTLAFAVAQTTGGISELRHAGCGTG